MRTTTPMTQKRSTKQRKAYNPLYATVPEYNTRWSDEPEMESSLHWTQNAVIVLSLERLWQDRDDFFMGSNLSIYFTGEQKKREFRGPDFFLIKGTQRRPRRSWEVEKEGGKFPNLIIEILSDETANVDRTKKKILYETVFKTPEYFWFSPYSLEFMGFRLVNGVYVEIPINEKGWRWSEELELFVGIWEARLRFFTKEGALVPTPQEAEALEKEQKEWERELKEYERQRAEEERQRAEEERQRAEEERQRAEEERQRRMRVEQKLDRLIAQIREKGIDLKT